MVKKKRAHPTAEEVLNRAWCYYCERDFEDLRVLTLHQKAKHFKCERCNKRLNTAGGLSVHMNQVHKENLGAIENALPNRADPSIEIFGMEGIPEDVIQQHNHRVLTEYHQQEAERRAATGNPTPGTVVGNAPKKPKVETGDDLKKRLAEFKARKAAGAARDGDHETRPGAEASASPQEPAQQQQYHSQATVFAPPQYASQASPPPPFAHAYGQAPYSMPPPQQQYQQPPSFAQAPPGYAPPAHQYAHPGMPPAYPHQGPPAYPQPGMYGAGSPHPGFPGRPHAGSPPQGTPFARPPSGGPPPNLPSRPAFGGAPPNQAYPGHTQPTFVQPQNTSFNHHPTHQVQQAQASHHTNGAFTQAPSANATPVDDLIATSAKESEKTEVPKKAAADPESEKKSKKDKDKDKTTKMVYSDSDAGPEEKMAKMPRYAFDPSQKKEQTVLGNAGEAAVTGNVVGEDDVVDKQG